MSPAIDQKPSIVESAVERFCRIVASETAKADAVVERIMRPFLEKVGA